VDGGVRGVRRVGSVDWGAIIGHCKEARKVVQLPGCLGVGGLRGVDPCFLPKIEGVLELKLKAYGGGCGVRDIGM